MKQILTINGKPLSDFGTYYDGSEWFRIPKRDVENIEIPGRNGDLTIDGNRFMNMAIPFNCYIPADFRRNYSALVNYLMSLTGYQRIESNEEPDVYRMGLLKEDLTPEMGQLNRRGSFILTVDFMPQKWLKSGEEEKTVNESITLVNPTAFPAKPILKVQGTGTIRVGNNTMVLSANTGTTIIDSEMENVYQGTINRNGDITFTNNEFPTLPTGETIIDYSGGITSLVVVPNWWQL